MEDYIFIFRADYQDISTVSANEMQNRNEQWMDWLDVLVAKERLAEGGNHLDSAGKVLRNKDQISDGPFREPKESVLGYIFVHAESYDEAVGLAKTCPLLAGEGTSVEVRKII